MCRSNHVYESRTKEQDVIILQEALVEFLFMTKIDGTPVQCRWNNVWIGFNGCWQTLSIMDVICWSNASGEDVGRGLSELQASGTYIASVLKEHYGSSESGTFARLPAPMKPAFDSISKLIDRWILGDALDRFNLENVKLSAAVPLEPYFFFKSHPLICGLFQFQLYTNLQHHSINCGPILYLTDLDASLAAYGDDHGYSHSWANVHRPRTENSDGILQVYSINAWRVTCQFCLELSPNRIKLSIKEKRLHSSSPALNVFRKQWNKTGDATLTISTVETTIQNLHLTSNTTTAQKKDRSLLQRQWAKSHKKTPLQLLDTLHHAIAAEQHIIHFDYLSLHLRCLRMLRALQIVLDNMLR